MQKILTPDEVRTSFGNIGTAYVAYTLEHIGYTKGATSGNGEDTVWKKPGERPVYTAKSALDYRQADGVAKAIEKYQREKVTQASAEEEALQNLIPEGDLRKKFGLNASGGSVALYDKEYPFLTHPISQEKGSLTAAVVKVHSAAFERETSQLEKQIVQAKDDFHIVIEDRSGHVAILQPDLWDNAPKTLKDDPQFIDTFSRELTNAITLAENITAERSGLLTRLSRANIRYDLAEVSSPEEAVFHAAHMQGATLHVPVYGDACVIPRHVAEQLEDQIPSVNGKHTARARPPAGYTLKEELSAPRETRIRGGL